MPSPQLEIFQNYAAFLRGTELAKLFLHGVPGTLPNGEQVAAQLQNELPNLETRAVGSAHTPTYHFIQEDAPVELAVTIDEFIRGL
ncbi:MAG: hypothetical protein MJE77_08745 [Proteobacteria bacterium]|nr:hypothetical protein [Pseudomonadota bacterium]